MGIRIEGRFQEGAGIQPQDFGSRLHCACCHPHQRGSPSSVPGRVLQLCAHRTCAVASNLAHHPVLGARRIEIRRVEGPPGSCKKPSPSEGRLTGSGNRPTGRPCRGSVPPFRELLPRGVRAGQGPIPQSEGCFFERPPRIGCRRRLPGPRPNFHGFWARRSVPARSGRALLFARIFPGFPRGSHIWFSHMRKRAGVWPCATELPS
jgi:hypothetical protein